MDKSTMDWFHEHVSENDLMIELFIKNPYNEFGNITMEEFADKHGWNVVIEILEKKGIM